MSELYPRVTVDGRRSRSRLQTVNDDFSFLALNFFHISPFDSVIILNVKKKKMENIKKNSWESRVQGFRVLFFCCFSLKRLKRSKSPVESEN